MRLLYGLQNQYVQHQLAMFFRDELISWSWRRTPGMPPASGAGGISTAELKAKVAANVDQVMTRIRTIAPQSFAEEVCHLTIFMKITRDFVSLCYLSLLCTS